LWIVTIYLRLFAMRQRVIRRSPTLTCRPSSAAISLKGYAAQERTIDVIQARNAAIIAQLGGGLGGGTQVAYNTGIQQLWRCCWAGPVRFAPRISSAWRVEGRKVLDRAPRCTTLLIPANRSSCGRRFRAPAQPVPVTLRRHTNIQN
jgi:hypothetical protein